MVKILSPLHSVSATGRFAGLIFNSKKGRPGQTLSYIRTPWTVPYNPTLSQSITRGMSAISAKQVSLCANRWNMGFPAQFTFSRWGVSARDFFQRSAVLPRLWSDECRAYFSMPLGGALGSNIIADWDFGFLFFADTAAWAAFSDAYFYPGGLEVLMPSPLSDDIPYLISNEMCYFLCGAIWFRISGRNFAQDASVDFGDFPFLGVTLIPPSSSPPSSAVADRRAARLDARRRLWFQRRGVSPPPSLAAMRKHPLIVEAAARRRV